MKKNLLILLPLMLFMICMPCVLANTDWWGWAGAGIIRGSSHSILSNTLWSSNFPNGNINFTAKTITVASKFQPIIDDLNSDSENEVIFFGTNTMYMYDGEGNFLDTYIFTENMCGSPGIVSKYSNGLNQVVVMTDGTASYTIHVMSIIGGQITEDESKTILTVKTSTCNVMGGLGSTNPSYVFIPYTDNVILGYDYKADTYVEDEACGNALDLAQSWTGVLKGGMSWAKQPSGETEMCWVGKKAGNTIPYLLVYNMNTGVCTNMTITSAVNNQNWTCSMANFGDPASTLEYIVDNFDTDTSSTATYMFDNSLTKIFTASSRDNTQATFSMVGDFNKDNTNELCFCTQNVFTCIDYAYNGSWQGLTRINAGDCYGFSAMGEYYDNRSNTAQACNTSNIQTCNTHEFITAGGIYMYDNYGRNMTRLYDFGLSENLGIFIPVALPINANYSKDLLYVSETKAIYYIASGTPAVCGNGVCEYTETVYNCFTDCYNLSGTIPTNQTIGSLPPNEQCRNNSWCASGNCVNYVCVGKAEGVACTIDDECQSRDCTSNYICAPVDIVQSINDASEMIGFRSASSKILLSFLITFTLAICGAVLLMSLNWAIGGFLGGVMGMMISIFVFGWLAVWFFIIIALFIVALVLIFAFIRNPGG